jgi:hypothetical protein
MSNFELPGTLNFSPALDLTQSLLPSNLYSQKPATHSMISGAPVLNVKVAGKITPTDNLLPLAVVMAWLTHLPSKNTLARVVMLTASIFSVVMGLTSVVSAKPLILEDALHPVPEEKKPPSFGSLAA